jgi:hypothetical protein
MTSIKTALKRELMGNHAKRHAAAKEARRPTLGVVAPTGNATCKHERLREEWQGIGETLWERTPQGRYRPGKTNEVKATVRVFRCCSCRQTVSPVVS